MKTATLVKENLPEFRGVVHLYRMNPPLPEIDFWGGDVISTHEYVVVSGIDHLYGTETYIFAADEFGRVHNWTELEGSFSGGVDHERALRNAGYEVVT